jgi:hypothetical protein
MLLTRAESQRKTAGMKHQCKDEIEDQDWECDFEAAFLEISYLARIPSQGTLSVINAYQGPVM